MYSHKIQYVVNSIVKSDDFNTNLSIICGAGIHYFKTLEPAFHIEFNLTYTGVYNLWCDNGLKICDGFYENGEKTGSWLYYHINGQVSSGGSYINNKKTIY